MKKALSLLILSAVVLSAAACGRSESTAEIGKTAGEAVENATEEAKAEKAESEETETEEGPYNEPGSDKESIVFDEKTQFAGYPVGIDGFSTTDADSFASRAAGLYKLDKGGNADEYEPDFYLEIYNIGGNLYGFYSEWGYAAIEFFAEDAEEFASAEAVSVPVKTLTFSNQSNAGMYWSEGVPAELTMNLTDKGLKFTDYNEASGESYLPEDADFIRLDEEMGHIEAFSYLSGREIITGYAEENGIQLVDIPHELVGIWRVLGSEDYAPFVELTKDGLAQIYMKNYGEEAVLYRGRYGVAKDGENDGYCIYIAAAALGWSSEPHLFSMRCRLTENGDLSCFEGDGRFGDDLLWDGALLLPQTVEDFPRFSWADAVGTPEAAFS